MMSNFEQLNFVLTLKLLGGNFHKTWMRLTELLHILQIYYWKYDVNAIHILEHILFKNDMITYALAKYFVLFSR